MNRTSARAVQQCLVLAIPAMSVAVDAPRGDDATVHALHDAAHACSSLARKRGVKEPARDLIYSVTGDLRTIAVQVGWFDADAGTAARNSMTWLAGISRAMLAVLGGFSPSGQQGTESRTPLA